MQASTTSCLLGTPKIPSSSSPPHSHSLNQNQNRGVAMASTSSPVRIAVVGDVHDEWNLSEDAKALNFLQPDIVLFTGDFGNENVELVRSVATLEIPKAVILGNHDAWSTQQFASKKKDRVQLQLECLGEEHVGYRRLDFPMSKLSVVGGRPFSCGGDRLFRKRLLSARYGINDMEESAKKIHKVASGTPEGHCVIFLAHNGPTGLGSNVNDICGRDWVFGGGDHGDPDLAQALKDLKETAQHSIPLVVFGHMHKELAYRAGLRKMIVVGEDNTIYLNGAIVPRVKKLTGQEENSNQTVMEDEPSIQPPAPSGTVRGFTLVEMLDGKLEKISETWISVIGDSIRLEEEYLLYRHG